MQSIILFSILIFSCTAPNFTNPNFFDDINQYHEEPLHEISPPRSEYQIASLNPLDFIRAQSNTPSSKYPIYAEKQYLKDACKRIITKELPYLQKFKYFELGNLLKFFAVIDQVNDVLSEDELSGDDKNTHKDSQAVAFLKWSYGTTTIHIYLKNYNAIDKSYEYNEDNEERFKIDKTVWHEIIHIFEYTNPSFEKKYDKYRDKRKDEEQQKIDTINEKIQESSFWESTQQHEIEKQEIINQTRERFEERHAGFFEQLLDRHKPYDTSLTERGTDIFRVKNLMISSYQSDIKDFWSTWDSDDIRSDLSEFYRLSGVRYNIDLIEQISERTQEMNKVGFFYLLGTFNQDSNFCQRERLHEEKPNTSDVRTNLHSVPIPIKPHWNYKEEQIYVTPELKQKLKKEYPEETLCITDRQSRVQ